MLVEEVFGWIKAVGAGFELCYIDEAHNRVRFELTTIAYNLIRLANLEAADAQLKSRQRTFGAEPGDLDRTLTFTGPTPFARSARDLSCDVDRPPLRVIQQPTRVSCWQDLATHPALR